LLAGLVTWVSLAFLETRTHALIAGCLSMLAGLIVSLPWMRKEIQLLFHL